MSISSDVLYGITFCVALSNGLLGGLFFIFSNTIMKALARISPQCGIAAMQAINIVILNPTFLTLFIGTALVSLCLGIFAAIYVPKPAQLSLIAGSILYVVGCFFVTITCHVPRNDALAKINSDHPDAIPIWQNYLMTWTRWNHVRTVSTFASTFCFIHALCQING